MWKKLKSAYLRGKSKLLPFQKWMRRQYIGLHIDFPVSAVWNAIKAESSSTINQEQMKTLVELCRTTGFNPTLKSKMISGGVQEVVEFLLTEIEALENMELPKLRKYDIIKRP